MWDGLSGQSAILFFPDPLSGLSCFTLVCDSPSTLMPSHLPPPTRIGPSHQKRNDKDLHNLHSTTSLFLGQPGWSCCWLDKLIDRLIMQQLQSNFYIPLAGRRSGRLSILSTQGQEEPPAIAPKFATYSTQARTPSGRSWTAARSHCTLQSFKAFGSWHCLSLRSRGAPSSKCPLHKLLVHTDAHPAGMQGTRSRRSKRSRGIRRSHFS